MPTAYDFMWLNTIPKIQAAEATAATLPAAANGVLVTEASEQNAGRKGPGITGQGRGLISIPHIPFWDDQRIATGVFSSSCSADLEWLYKLHMLPFAFQSLTLFIDRCAANQLVYPNTLI